MDRDRELMHEQAELVGYLGSCLRQTLDGYSNMTTEEFQHGADRRLRASMVVALRKAGLATLEDLVEYADELRTWDRVNPDQAPVMS